MLLGPINSKGNGYTIKLRYGIFHGSKEYNSRAVAVGLNNKRILQKVWETGFQWIF